MDISDRQNRALAKLQAFQTNPPSFWDEGVVSQFNEVVSELEEAFERDERELSSFRISEAELKPSGEESGSTAWVDAGRNVGRFSRVPYSGLFTAGKQRSERRYCDNELARRKLDGLVLYIQSLQIQGLQPTPEPRKKIGF